MVSYIGQPMILDLPTAPISQHQPQSNISFDQQIIVVARHNRGAGNNAEALGSFSISDLIHQGVLHHKSLLPY